MKLKGCVLSLLYLGKTSFVIAGFLFGLNSLG